MNDAAIASTLSRYPFQRMQGPTLVISLAEERFGTYAGARYTAERIPSARFVGYAGGGHVWVGHHQEMTAETSPSSEQSPPELDDRTQAR